MITPQANPALALADEWQRGFPLQREPFAVLAEVADLSQAEVLEYFQLLKDQGVLARLGATVRPNSVGASTLAAMAVPADRLEETAWLVNAYPAVNHNYERENPINLWFVVTAEDRQQVLSTLDAIAQQTGLDVIDLPLERPYHIDLGFRLDGDRRKARVDTARPAQVMVDHTDRELLSALEDGLEFVRRPYVELGRRIGLDEAAVLRRLHRLVETGIITRFGCILRHRRLGYRANAMAVWDVDDAVVDDIAAKLAKRDEVTLCYRRTRRKPAWPFNLFAMIHGSEREIVRQQIAAAEQAVGLKGMPSAVLFSTRCFKQSGARLRPEMKGAA